MKKKGGEGRWRRREVKGYERLKRNKERQVRLGQRGEGTRERLAKRARSESSRISQDKIFFVSKKILDFLCFPMPPLPSKVYSTSNLEMSNAKRVIVSAPVSGPLRGGSSPLAPSCSLSCSPQELAGLAGLSVVPEGLAATVVIR